MKRLIIGVLGLLLLGGCTQASKQADAPHHEPAQRSEWTGKTELFMEYGEPVAGKTASFRINLTNLKNYKPVAEGSLTLAFTGDSGESFEVRIDGPDKPGTFMASVVFKKPGMYSMKALIAGPSLNDEIEIHNIHVEETAASHQHDTEAKTDIIFRKEQQWAIDFMTGAPVRRTIESSFIAAGEFVPAANGEMTVSAPLAGSISYSGTVPYVGKRVAKGSVLAVIEPPIHQQGGIGQLSASHAEARQRYLLAEKEYARAKRLYEAKAAPKRRLDEAELSLESARAALEPLEKAHQELKGRISNGRVVITAPISGTVVEMFASGGRGIEAGQPILRIVNTGTLWLKANVPATAISGLKNLERAAFSIPGMDGALKPSRIVTTNDLVEPKTRTVAVLFEVPNPKGILKVGMFADVPVSTGAVKDALTLPEDALFEDEGRYFAYVQGGGESFERREVKTGLRGNGSVQIVGGLEEDERVVLLGGYYVKLASVSTRIDPHAGHSH